MATKCPYCGSPDVKCLNVGKRILAGCASGITATLLSPFMRGDAKYLRRMFMKVYAKQRNIFA